MNLREQRIPTAGRRPRLDHGQQFGIPLAFWAITVGTSIVSYVPGIGEDLRYLILGGNVVGQSALLRFYVLHCVVLPLFMGVLIGIHFWRIRKDGGLSRPLNAEGKREREE